MQTEREWLETYRTFDEWNELGFRVCKGQKSHKRSADGKALFQSTQVLPAKRYDHWANDYEDGGLSDEDLTFAYDPWMFG